MFSHLLLDTSEICNVNAWGEREKHFFFLEKKFLPSISQNRAMGSPHMSHSKGYYL